MAAQVTRGEMAAWLLRNGFRRLPGSATSHIQYERAGVKIMLPGHGPNDLTKKHVGQILRALARLGLDPREVRRQLGGGAR